MSDLRAWAPDDPLCIAPAAARLKPVIQSHAHLSQIAADNALMSADLLACRRSPWYWLVNHCVTLDEHDAGEPYKRFPALEYLRHATNLWWWAGVKYPTLALPKSRKMLMTWLLALTGFGEAQFVPGRRNLVQSYKEDESMAIIAKMHGIWLRQPPWIRQPCTWTMTEARFSNDSVFKAIPGGAEQWQGPTCSMGMIDEVGDHDEGQLTYEAALAACGVSKWRQAGRCGRFILVGRCPPSWWHDVFLADLIGETQ